MSYLDFDLGNLSEGESVSVALSGVESDVMLMTLQTSDATPPASRPPTTVVITAGRLPEFAFPAQALGM